jgi:purine-binding chemotaxis protein CheW
MVIVFDRVFELTSALRSAIYSAPDIGTRWFSAYIEGVARRDDGFVVIIDLAHLLSEDEAVDLAETPQHWRAA